MELLSDPNSRKSVQVRTILCTRLKHVLPWIGMNGDGCRGANWLFERWTRRAA